MKSRRGFTLIELLLVIGIIAFLMALAGIAYLAQIRGAKIRAAQALLGKIETALIQYHALTGTFPPDSGFNQPTANSNKTTVWNGTTYVNYDSGSLYRYLGQARKVYHSDGTYWKTMDAFLTLNSTELVPYNDPKMGASFIVVDPWQTPIGYIGDTRRVIHNRGGVDLFSCGPSKVTAETNSLSYGLPPNVAFDGLDNDSDSVPDNAAELGVAQLNGTLTADRRLKASDVRPAGEVLDNLNNWTSQR